MLANHIKKDNLHHAYLIEGVRAEIEPEIIEILTDLEVATQGNPDFFHLTYESFKIDDARELRELAAAKSFSPTRKIFLIYTNGFLLEAQNSLLKIFEEPLPNSHFFVVVPSIGGMLPTLISRFYYIPKSGEKDTTEGSEFIQMPITRRLEYIKELLAVEEGGRALAQNFLNSLESTLHQNAL